MIEHQRRASANAHISGFTIQCGDYGQRLTHYAHIDEIDGVAPTAQCASDALTRIWGKRVVMGDRWEIACQGQVCVRLNDPEFFHQIFGENEVSLRRLTAELLVCRSYPLCPFVMGCT